MSAPVVGETAGRRRDVVHTGQDYDYVLYRINIIVKELL